MVPLHPNIVEHDGKKAFVVLTYEEFLLLQEEIESFEDLKTLRAAKSEEADAATVTLSDAKKELGL
jgi:hypothetical protein